MPWARLDDAMPESEKIADLSDAAFRAQVTAICYSARNLTDGYLPARYGKLYTGRPRVLKELIPAVWHLSSNLCHKCAENPVAVAAAGQGDGYYIHDFLDYNPTREQVLTEREERQEAKRRGGQARAATAGRSAGGRFASKSPAEPPAEAPAAHQQATSPVPVPIPVPQEEKPDQPIPPPRSAPAPQRVVVVGFEQAFGRLLSPMELELVKALEDEHPKERIEYALREAAALHKTTVRYVQRTCERMANDGDDTTRKPPASTSKPKAPSANAILERARLASAPR